MCLLRLYDVIVADIDQLKNKVSRASRYVTVINKTIISIVPIDHVLVSNSRVKINISY